MRFTVKAKLASAFGVVILLSIIAGARRLREADGDGRHHRHSRRPRRPDGEGRRTQGRLLSRCAPRRTRSSRRRCGLRPVHQPTSPKTREQVAKPRTTSTPRPRRRQKMHGHRSRSPTPSMNGYQDETSRSPRLTRRRPLIARCTKAARPVADALECSEQYIVYVKKTMAESAVQAKEDGNRAELLLMCLVIASLLDAAGGATWIAMNISRALARRSALPTRSRSATSARRSMPPATTRSAISSSR